MKEKIVVCGDDHIRHDEPFYSAKEDYFSWFINRPFNNNSNVMIHVGDLFHSNEPVPAEYDLAYWYLSSLQFKKIYLLSGNGIHEYNRIKQNYAIEPFSRMGNVETITQPQEVTIGSVSVLFLPWVPSKKWNDRTMREWYESLEGEYDYIFGHFAHTDFFGTEININQLKGKRRMGHIHVPDKSGEYVGVNTITREDEKGINCKLNIIDQNTKKEELYDIPRFLDYYEVEYPNDLPEVEAVNPYWTVKNAPDISRAEMKYRGSFIKEIVLEKDSKLTEEGKNTAGEKKSVKEYFDSFVEDNKIKKSVEKILREVI
jgi:hypothetical protein